MTVAAQPTPEKLAAAGPRELPWRLLLSVLVLSLAVQLLASANVKPLPDYDEAIYWDVSHNCHRRGLFLRSMGEGLLFFDHPPLFLYLASTVFYLTDDIGGFRFVVSLTSLALIAATALLAHRLLGPTAAMPAAVVLAFNPMFVFYANSAYQDVPFMLPIVLALLAAFAGRPIASGLLTGAACLVKYFAAGFAGAIALYFLVEPGKGPRAAAKYLGTFACVSALWPLAGLFLDPGGFLGKLEYWKLFLTMKTTSSIKHHPVAELGPYLQTILDRVTLLHALLLVAALVWALWRLAGFGGPLRTVALTAAAYIAVLLGPFALRTDRYLVEVLPLLAVLAAGLLGAMTPTARSALLAIVSVAGLFVPMPGMERLPQFVRPQFVPAVAEYVRSVEAAAGAVARELAPGEIVLVNWNGPRIGYLAKRSYHVMFAYEEFGAVMKFVDQSRVVVRDHESGRWHLPELSPGQVAELDRKLTEEFTAVDYGKVRVYTRKAGSNVVRR